MNWQRFSRRDCPVCGGTRKDCRQNTLSKLIHCRELDAAPSGYVFRGYDSLGFGMWAEQGDVEAWTEEKRNEWQERRKQEQAIEQARFKSLLVDSERDLTLRSILNQLELSEEHRLQLRERGMSEEQIEAGLYRTVEPWQRLQLRVDDRLAGVLRGGKGLYIPASGILCPIPNLTGELVGWQLRLDDPGEFPKYLWASSEKKRRKNGPSVHLKNGELPLAYFAPSIPPHAVISQGLGQQSGHATLIPVALTEGVGFKPALTAHRLGIDSIGASGGHFAASPQTLNAYLEGIKTLHGEKNPQEIALQPILFADAGCIANENVLQVYTHTIRQLQELGYEAKIAWCWSLD